MIHARPDSARGLERMINRSGSVVTDVIWLLIYERPSDTAYARYRSDSLSVRMAYQIDWWQGSWQVPMVPSVSRSHLLGTVGEYRLGSGGWRNCQ